MRSLPLWVLLPCLVVAHAGCGAGGPRTHEMSGQVTFDGAPVPEGDITFVPLDSGLSADAGKVKDGAYKFPVKEGKHKVQVRASKLMPLPTGQRGAMGEKEAHQEYLPERYHAKTELTAEVTQAAKLDFTLTSKK